MTIENDLQQSMNEESQAAASYRGRAASARSDGDEVSAKLWEHIAEEEDGHYNEFRDRLNLLYEELPRYTGKEALERILSASPSGVYVTVTDAGDTPFRVGANVPSEMFDRENEYRKEAGKRPALGEYHY